jgi:MFS family permease
LMLSSLTSGGVAIFAFYAMQPYLLELYGGPGDYAIAGIAAAIVAGAQILGGLIVPYIAKAFKKRTSLFVAGTTINVAALALIAIAGNFWLVLLLLAVWAIVFAAVGPVRQSFFNGLVSSEQRATVISTDNLLSSASGVITQPVLGKVSEVWGYPAAYLGSSLFQLLALPFLILARRENAKSDEIRGEEEIRS